MRKKEIFVILVLFIFIIMILPGGAEKKNEFNDFGLKTSAGASTVFYDNSPSNTGVTMIEGTFDNSDNMKINDDSNSVFTSTEAVAIPDEFADSITINDGGYVSGSVSDTWVDNAVAYVVSGTYLTKVTYNFDPALAGRNFYISGHMVSTGGAGTLWVNGIVWYNSLNIDFDDQLKNGVNSIYYMTGGMSSHQSRSFFLKLVEVGDPVSAEINYTMTVDFSEIKDETLLGMNISSFHYTDFATTITGNVFNFSSSSYIEMFSTSNIVETENFYSTATNGNDFLDGSGDCLIQFTGENSDFTFDVLMDYIVITFNYTTLGDPPTWDNLTFIDPLELGLNETISISVYSDNTVTYVYLEIAGVNNSMWNIEGDIYSYNWTPSESGYSIYKIFMIDDYDLTTSMQGGFSVINSPAIVITSIILFALLLFMLFLYLKMRVFIVILIVFVFSLIFGGIVFSIYLFPFTPYLQLFFLAFQTVIFLSTSMKLWGRGKYYA